MSIQKKIIVFPLQNQSRFFYRRYVPIYTYITYIYVNRLEVLINSCFLLVQIQMIATFMQHLLRATSYDLLRNRSYEPQIN